VLTTALNVASELSRSDFDIIFIGNILRRQSLSIMDPLAEDMLKDMHADIVFIGSDGFDLGVGLMTPNVFEARAKRAMIKASIKVVAVCDSRKIIAEVFP
jgi:DeoR family transcriptional regulator, aga operon transcriptional repressor